MKYYTKFSILHFLRDYQLKEQKSQEGIFLLLLLL